MMKTTTSEVRVTQSAELLARLRTVARELGVLLEWVVAGLVADSVDVTA